MYECAKCKHNFKVFADTSMQSNTLTPPTSCRENCRRMTVTSTRTCRKHVFQSVSFRKFLLNLFDHIPFCIASASAHTDLVSRTTFRLSYSVTFRSMLYLHTLVCCSARHFPCLCLLPSILYSIYAHWSALPNDTSLVPFV